MGFTSSTSWQVPKFIIHEGEKYFDPNTLRDAIRLLTLSRVSISFSKGSRDTYFICSGIIKDDQSHESKIVYKKRFEDTEKGPISSYCDCHKWTLDDHCSHSITLFLTFLLHQHHEAQFGPKKDGTSHPPIPLNSTFAVSPVEYGTILNGPHQLERASANATYSSLQYLLHNHKIINFPIPENFKGKLIIQIISNEHFSGTTDQIENLPIVRFKHRDEDNQTHREISLFENLYLFNWAKGQAYHLSSELKNLVQKLRIYGNHLNINDLIKLVKGVNTDHLTVIIDEVLLEKIPRLPVNCKIHLHKKEKPSQISFEIIFHDENENTVQAPDFLTAFTFQGGLLGSFRKKKDAYNFITGLAESLESESPESYTKYLISSSQKSHWQNLINYTLSQEKTYLYNSKVKSLCQYDTTFLITFYKSLVNCFGDMFFRFSQCFPETGEITFTVSSTTVYQGLANFYNRMTPFGIQFFYNKNRMNRWSSKIRFERKLQATKWFELELNVSDQDLEIIQKANMDSNIAITKQGMILLSREQKDLLKFVKKYTQYENQNPPKKEPKNTEVLNKFVLPFNRTRIFELFELKKLGLDGALTEEEIKLCERLSTMEKMPQYDVPNKLDKILRPYQRTGYTWLRFLYENQLGACLADDMGLGKTLQTIAFLQSIYDKIESVLIVCPVTILLNWEKEFNKFSNMDIHIYHGENRNYPQKAKVLLTSYGIMKREIDDTFSDKFFDIFILDEVQHLKNIRSQGAYVARKIKSNYRICLTGTPIENDLAEFYNILDLSVPGIWGDLQFVRTTSTKKSRLIARKTASPFILRRTKSQVLTELPPKVENNIFLNFEHHEKENYLNSLIQIRKKIESTPSKRRYGEILGGLLELRQKCLWQKPLTNATFPRASINSTKIKFLLETLEPIIEEGHQAIIFSQFTTYLDIIQKILWEKHWKLARIDGSQTIKRRQQEVDKFQEGKCPIFLISLKAGGIGLNLTAASYVFVMDPWWNPAVEAQAIDRAHRIGQKNPLTVYRPIMKGSVEEKVLELQQMKKELFKDLLPDDESDLFTGKLTMKDFESLFQ